MPRPIRIEYENAFYHVMNRGRARNNIFFTEIHYLTFLKILGESCERFGCVIHGYCLMPNHYHLLIQTPNANLGRIMRHVNGVYTQKFNNLQKIDGSLFKGRYKAILVDQDDYLLELSKYIHKNPIQTKNKKDRLARELKDYKYSSYRNYLNISPTPRWLNKELTLSKFKNDRNFIERYQFFVEQGENKELEEFFNKKNQEAILGAGKFKDRVLTGKLLNQPEKQDQIKKEVNNKVTAEEIVTVVANVFMVSRESILKRQEGRPKKNIPKVMAIYLIQKYKNLTLKEIADMFELKHSGSVSRSLSKMKEIIKDNFLEKKLGEIEGGLWFMERT